MRYHLQEAAGRISAIARVHQRLNQTAQIEFLGKPAGKKGAAAIHGRSKGVREFPVLHAVQPIFAIFLARPARGPSGLKNPAEFHALRTMP